VSPSASASPDIVGDPGGPPLLPNVWFEFSLEKNPIDAGTDLYRWSFRPLAQPDALTGWKEDRLISVTPLERALSTPDGQYELPRVTVVLGDTDGLLRALLVREDTGYWEGREGIFYLLSDQGLLAGTPPMMLFRGVVASHPTLLPDRQVSIDLVDVIGSEFSIFNLDKTLGVLIGDEHPTKPKETEGLIYSMVMGEVSDAGAIDALGNNVEKGMIPARDCGDKIIGDGNQCAGVEDTNAPMVVNAANVNVVGSGNIAVPTRILVAPIINGVIGPASISPTGMLDPNGNGAGGPIDPHADRFVFDGIAVPEGSTLDGYIAWLTTVSAFHPCSNPLADPHAVYKYIDAAPTNPDWPPRNPADGPYWQYYVDFISIDDGQIWGPTNVSEPTNLTAAPTGDGGTSSLTYGVSTLTALGESKPVFVTVDNAPAVRTPDNPVTISWEPPNTNPALVLGYRLLGPMGVDDAGQACATSSLGVTQNTSEAPTFVDDGSATPVPVVPDTGDAPADDSVWAWRALAIGELAHFNVFASDLAVATTPDGSTPGSTGTQPKRIIIDPNNPYLLQPESDAWPHDTRWVEFINSDGVAIRQSGFYLRGPLLAAHRDGSVTAAAQVCGYKGLNGVMIDQAFYQFQFMLNEFALKNHGEGYRSGDWGPTERFANGDPVLWTRKFKEAQDLTIDWLGGLGSIGAIAITDPGMTIREFISRFCVTYGSFFGVNRFGQPYPVLLDPAAALNQGRRYRNPIEIDALEQAFAPEYRTNQITFSYDWDPDAQTYRVVDLIIEDVTSQFAHGTGGIKRVIPATHECFCSRDAATVIMHQTKFLQLFRKAPRYVGFPTDLTALHDENGDRARVTHWDGLGLLGDIETNLAVMRHRFDVMPEALEIGQPVTITGLDMSRVA
jgi:hypothetical protein